VSGTEKDHESLEPNESSEEFGTGRGKTRRGCKRQDQENLELKESRPGESATRRKYGQESLEPKEARAGDSGTRRGKARRICNRKREEHESLEPEEGRPRESGTGRGETGKMCN
jgi:hypothetical protein